MHLDAPVRLNDGNSKLEGRVEILYQGVWGTICDDGWDDIDATVVCTQLGFLNGTATLQSKFGSGTGPVWLNQVACLGNESKLTHCMHNGAGNIGNCSHTQDVGVQCNAHGKWLVICIMHVCTNNLVYLLSRQSLATKSLNVLM